MVESSSRDVSPECWKEWISKKAVANAGVVIVNSHNQALLLLKPKTGEWELPSGAIDKDEYPKMAAIRELSEETNINLSEEALIELGTVTAFHPTYTQDKTDIVVTFMAFIDSKAANVVPREEHSAIMWLSLERIDDPAIPTHPTTRRQLWMAYEVVKTKGYRESA